MKVKKKSTTPQANVNKKDFLFTRMNFYIMIVGLVFITVGFFLMIGGGSDDPAVFNEAIFNAQRLTVAPILLLIGYALQLVAIFYTSPEKKSE